MPTLMAILGIGAGVCTLMGVTPSKWLAAQRRYEMITAQAERARGER